MMIGTVNQHVESLKPAEFIQRYGNIPEIAKGGDISLFGSLEEAGAYLGGQGFTETTGIDRSIGSIHGAVKTYAKDNTDYGKMGGEGMEIGDTGKSILSTLYNEGGIRKFLSPVTSFLTIDGRDHARVYDLEDGKVAVTLHQDTGLNGYFGDGDVFGGAGKLLYDHFEIGPKIEEYKNTLMGYFKGTFGLGGELKDARQEVS
jgi:hypothetical protein